MSLDTPSRNSQPKRPLSSPEFESDSKRSTYAQVVMSPPPSSSDSTTQPTPHFNIPDEALNKISDLLIVTFQDQIESLVDKIASGVVSKLSQKIESLEAANTALKVENIQLNGKISYLEDRLDDQEQYSRRNILRISGISEANNENTDELVLGVCNATGSGITLSEIDRTHRVGKPTPFTANERNNTTKKPRDIIVKFGTYRSRQKLFMKRSLLKDNGYKGTFINEDLTRKRSFLLFKARELVKSRHLLGAWSSDGKLLIKDNKSKVHRLSEFDQLESCLTIAPIPE